MDMCNSNTSTKNLNFKNNNLYGYAFQNRSLANVLLRRLFSSSFDEFWPNLPDELQEAIKRELMLAVQEELTPPVRKKVCDAIAELARNLIGKLQLENPAWYSGHYSK